MQKPSGEDRHTQDGQGQELSVDLPWAPGMVLQQNADQPVHGRASPGSMVRWELRGADFLEQGTLLADSHGRWQARLGGRSAPSPCEFRVWTDTEELVLDDILFGEVLLCSGQSNMVIPLSRVRSTCKKQLEECRGSLVRMFKVPDRIVLDQEKADIDYGAWKVLDEDTMAELGAVAWFFASYLSMARHVPLGIVLAAFGGSPLDAFLPRTALDEFPASRAALEPWLDPAWLAAQVAQDNKAAAEWERQSEVEDAGLAGPGTEWYQRDLPDEAWDLTYLPSLALGESQDTGPGVYWFRKHLVLPRGIEQEDTVLHLGTLVDADSVWVNNVLIGSTGYRYPPRRYTIPRGLLQSGDNLVVIRLRAYGHELGATPGKTWILAREKGENIPLSGYWYWKQGCSLPVLAERRFLNRVPSALYHGMIEPLLDFGFRAVVWYQGESDTELSPGYAERLRALIRSWRSGFGKELPFLVLQLPEFGEAAPDSFQVDSPWARIRQAQAEVSRDHGVFLVPALNLGEWNDIHPEQKAELGRRVALVARKNIYHEPIAAGSPYPTTCRVEGKVLRLTCAHAEGGLYALGSQIDGSSDGTGVRGLVLRGADGSFTPATGIIEGSDLLVPWGNAAPPTEIRYAWADNPAGCNLFNGAGWPGLPFRIRVTEQGNEPC